ncbi:MAG: RIP metalloprotease RseP [Coraliomargarita sp.]
MNFLANFWYIFVALFCLGFSIFIHELGHFIAAKKRGLIADRFSIGFGPRICGWKWKGTDFRISLLPLGGYVSLPQLADMGRLEGAEQEEDRLPPISYADKMIVAVMGAVFNIILAFLISLVLWNVGRDIIKSTQVDIVPEEIVNSEGEVVPGPAYAAGIQIGDEIQRIDGQRVNDWMQLMNAVMTSTGRSADDRPQVEVEFLRNGQTQTVVAYPELISSEAIRALGLQPDSNLVVTQVQRGMPAEAAGLQVGDIPVALNGEAIESSAFLHLFLQNHQGGSIDVTVLRDGEEITLPIEPVIAKGEDRLRFGFAYYYDAKKVRVHRNPIEQLGIMANTMRMTLYALIHKGSDVKVRNMSGPVGIVDGLSTMARYGWVDLIWFLALINVNLALFNLLPIPVLDGGHMLFATIAKLRGRPLPRKFMENVQGGFVLLLLGFVVYVSFFDVSRITERIGISNTETPAIENVDPEQTTAPEQDAPDTE